MYINNEHSLKTIFQKINFKAQIIHKYHFKGYVLLNRQQNPKNPTIPKRGIICPLKINSWLQRPVCVRLNYS